MTQKNHKRIFGLRPLVGGSNPSADESSCNQRGGVSLLHVTQEEASGNVSARPPSGGPAGGEFSPRDLCPAAVGDDSFIRTILWRGLAWEAGKLFDRSIAPILSVVVLKYLVSERKT